MGGRWHTVERNLDRIGIWFTAYTVLTGALSWVAKGLTELGPLGWSEAIFLGLGAATLIMLALSAGLVSWRVFRPLAAPPSSPQPFSPAPSPDLPEWHEAFEGFRREIKQTVLNQIQYMNALDARIDKLAERIDARLESDLTQLAITAGELAGLKAKTEKRLLEYDHAFLAIWHREVLLARASELQHGAEALDLGARGGSLAEGRAWADWERDYQRWRGTLESWLFLASLYWPDVRDVKKLPDNIHKLSWTFGDSQFPDSAAIHEYRAFCVICHNWNDIKDKAHAAASNVAFAAQVPIDVKA